MKQKTRIVLIALVAVLLFACTLFAISAEEPANSLETVELTFNGTTQDDAKNALDEAMKKAEEGYNVKLTLKANMVFSPSSATRFDFGTDKTTDGVVTVTGENGTATPYGITINGSTILNFKGNVAFENISIDKTYANVGVYTASYIMVTEGVGRFGNTDSANGYGNVVNNYVGNYTTNAEQRKVKVSLAGSNLEIYSGDYVVVAANFQGSKLVINNPSIVFGGNAKAETVAGRGVYTGESDRGAVEGASSLTIQDAANVTDAVTTGHYKGKSLLSGDANLTVTGGTINKLYLLSYDTYYPGTDFTFKKSDGNRSVYTVTLSGGKVSGVTAVMNNTSNGSASGRKINVNGFDLDVTIGKTDLNGAFYGGVVVAGSADGMTFDNASIDVILNGATVDKTFYGGSYIASTGTNKIVDDIARTFTIEGSTISSDIYFGSYLGTVNAEHKGATTVTYVNKGTITISSNATYGGSRMAAENTVHSGTTYVELGSFWNKFTKGDVFAGSLVEAANANHKGNATIVLNGGAAAKGAIIYGGSNLTVDSAKHSGGSTMTAQGGAYIQSGVYGGSLISAAADHSGVSSLIVKDAYSTEADFSLVGGSNIIGENGKHSGKSIVSLESNVKEIRNKLSVYGGSNLNALGAVHSGTSEIRSYTGNYKSSVTAMYGGSHIVKSGACQTGASAFNNYTGSITTVAAIYGGSNFADYDATSAGDSATETFGHLADSHVFFNGGTFVNAAGLIYGGSNMAYETASIQNGLAVHGTAKTASKVTIQLSNTYKSVYAGSNLGTYKGTLYGKHELNVVGTQTPNGVIACAELLNAESKLIGDTALTFGSAYTQINTGCTVIAAGVYGNGLMDGNSQLKISGSIYIQQFGTYSTATTAVNVVTAGCYGTNDLDTTDVTLATTGKAPIYGGIRQKGNVSLVIDNASGAIRAPIVVAGFRSNVGKLNGKGGNVSVEVTGSIVFRHQVQVLGYGASNKDFQRYSSCEGDIRVILDGGVLGDGNNEHAFICGGSNYGGDMSAGGTHIRAGFNVCKGNTYVEITDKVSFNTTKYWTLVPSGQYPAEGQTYVKFIGNINIPVRSDGKEIIKLRPNGIPSRISTVGQMTVDFTQLTGTKPLYTYNQGSAPIEYAQMSGQTVTFSVFDPSNPTFIKNLAGNTLTWNGCSATYEALTAFDGYAKNPNGMWFADATSGKKLENGFSGATGNVKIMCGNVYSAVINVVNNSKDETIEEVLSKYEVVGTSLRVGNLAMRCRAKIDQEFFDSHKTINADDGFKFARMGIIVGLNNQSVYQYDSVLGSVVCGQTDACIWNGSELHETGFTTDSKYPGYYLYAAAITGYTTNGLINERSKVDVYFRAYCVLEDANGVQIVVYLDNPSDNTQTNYGKSLNKTAQQVKEQDSEWYNSTPERKQTVDMILAGPVTQYDITLNKGSELGTLSTQYTGKTDTTTSYKITVTPKDGYEVSTITINGTSYTVTNNSTNCTLSSDATVDVTYARKNNSELQARRNTVLAKMKQIARTKFLYSEDYEGYWLADSTLSVYKQPVYKGTYVTKDAVSYYGMPYSNLPSISYDAFMKDFVSGPNNKGIYTIGKNVKVEYTSGDTTKTYLWGTDCADVIYWSWATVSSTMNSFISYGFNENFGLVKVGGYDVPAEYIDSKGYIDHTDRKTNNQTGKICIANGEQAMYEAYAFLLPGDALMACSSAAGHVIMAGETTEGNGVAVYVSKNKDGTINGENSYIMYCDQNSGYKGIGGMFEDCYLTSCKWNTKKTFASLYEEGYLPVTCKELMDVKYTVEDATYTESIDASELNGVEDVTAGSVSSNYYVSRIEMTITNKATGEKSTYIRYMDEKMLRGFDYSVFTRTTGLTYSSINIYTDVFDANALSDGEYNCTVKLDVANGETFTVRDFDFTK